MRFCRDHETEETANPRLLLIAPRHIPRSLLLLPADPFFTFSRCCEGIKTESIAASTAAFKAAPGLAFMASASSLSLMSDLPPTRSPWLGLYLADKKA